MAFFIYTFFSVCPHIHLIHLHTSLFNFKERVSVFERLQPSLATTSQDLKAETSNKGKQRFIIMIIISRCQTKGAGLVFNLFLGAKTSNSK